MYPIFLNLRGRQVVIVGGGKVAARKVRGLLEAGADRVRVVSPAFDDSIAAEAEKIMAQYHADHLRGAVLVFAATDSPAVNEQVARDARAVGAWVNRADDHDESTSDFATPAIRREGSVVLAVSAGGNPAIATRIRDAAEISPGLAAMAGTMSELRPLIQARHDLPQARRREALVWLAGDEAVGMLQKQGMDSVRNMVLRMLEAI